MTLASAGNLSARDVRTRLSGARPGADPGRVDIVAATRHWRAGFRERLGERLAPAAVLIPIVQRADKLMVVLTRRSETLSRHAGQIAFPGGRLEARDGDIVETALRETHEELGIEPQSVEVAGVLSPVATLSGYAVTPVVGLLADGPRLQLDRKEVLTAFEVPLGLLLDPANQRRRSGDEDRVAFPLEFHFAGQRIWGVTAAILVALREALYPVEPGSEPRSEGCGDSLRDDTRTGSR